MFRARFQGFNFYLLKLEIAFKPYKSIKTYINIFFETFSKWLDHMISNVMIIMISQQSTKFFFENECINYIKTLNGVYEYAIKY